MVKGRARLPVRRHVAVVALLGVVVTLVGWVGAASSSAASRSAVGFSPVSVTFVSAESGWVLGVVSAGSGSKLAVERTTDGGATWSRSPAPDVSFSAGTGPEAIIRFANVADGWIAGPASGGLSSTLWSTHDGGASWRREAVPGGGQVTALDASDGAFQLAVIGTDVPAVHLYSAAGASDSWVRSATSLPLGAGPVASAQLTLQAGEGWALENDRVVVAGARLTSGSWASWTPPCRKANGLGFLAAASATDLVAVCDEGVWGPPAPGLTAGAWLFTSDDAGRQFHTVVRIDAPQFENLDSVGSVATAPDEPQVVVVGGAGMAATFDGGHIWRTVYTASAGQLVRFVGFTTASQGVAIVAGGTRPSALLMTHDRGASWHPVALPAGTT